MRCRCLYNGNCSRHKPSRRRHRMRQPTGWATQDPEGVRLTQSRESFHVCVNLDGSRVVALARWGEPRLGAPAVRTARVWRASSCRDRTQTATAMLCEAPVGSSAAVRVVPDVRWPRSHARPIVCCESRVASWSFTCSILSPLKPLTQQPPPPRIVPPLRMISRRP
jgi:hypothetical protein